jgi:hypothetical protein
MLLLGCVKRSCFWLWLLLLAAVLKALCLQPLVLLLWALKLLVVVSAFLVLALGPFLTGTPIVPVLLLVSS